jgi:hypothetical protein
VVAERRIIVLPADWSSTEPERDPRGELARDLTLEQSARALCRAVHERALLAAITRRR